MFAPILRLHRITIEQMAILEPAVVESMMATFVTVLREAMEAAVQKGYQDRRPMISAWGTSAPN